MKPGSLPIHTRPSDPSIDPVPRVHVDPFPSQTDITRIEFPGEDGRLEPFAHVYVERGELVSWCTELLRRACAATGEAWPDEPINFDRLNREALEALERGETLAVPA